LILNYRYESSTQSIWTFCTISERKNKLSKDKDKHKAKDEYKYKNNK